MPATTTRQSVKSSGGQGNAGSGGASSFLDEALPNQAISADGRWVAFTSTATNLVSGTSLPAGGLYLHDRGSGSTVAIPWIGGVAFPTTVVAAEPVLSQDGSAVAFTAITTLSSPGLPFAGRSATPYVLVFDQHTGATTVVSVDAQGQPTPGWQPSISADGRYVAYTQWAPRDTSPPILSNLTANPTHIGGCTGPNSSTISVTATDPDDPVASVTLTFTPNLGSQTSESMTAVGSNVWQASITIDSFWNPGPIAYSVQASDSHGNTSSPLSPSASQALNYDGCIQ